MEQRRIRAVFRLILLMALAPITVLAAEALLLDCSITRPSPLLDLANQAQLAALVRLEKYRFVIPAGGGTGLATTPRAEATAAQIIEAPTQFQIDFENKRVVIDRMTAEFQLSFQGAEKPIGSGMCTRIEQRRF